MLTMSGSIGSGSVPVIPSVVAVVEVVDVAVEVDDCPVVEAKARSTGPVNRARSRTNANFLAVRLYMGESPFPAQMCAGRRLGSIRTKSDLFVEFVVHKQLRGVLR